MSDEKMMQDQMDETRRQMGETRASLADKLDSLENKFAATVQGATDTVNSVQEAVQGATDAVSSVTESMGNTVDSVKDTVEESVQSVRDKFNETVSSVSDSLDLSAHVARHPWPMMAGAVAVGFLGGCLLPSKELLEETTTPSPMRHKNGPSYASARHNGRGTQSESRPAPAPSLMQTVVAHFEPELDKLKSLALGALVSVVHDWLAPKVPESFRPQFNSVMNEAALKLTGTELSANGPAGARQQDAAPGGHRFAG